MFDTTSKIDVTARLEKRQARKLLAEILKKTPNFESFTRHCRDELRNDAFTTVDALHALKSGQIYSDAEFESEAWRYRIETSKIVLILQFRNPETVVCVTAWRKVC